MNMVLSNQMKIPIIRREANFDRACDSANEIAIGLYQMDENGRVPDSVLFAAYHPFVRTTDCIVLKFAEYTRCGSEHTYLFTARIERNLEE